MSNNLFPVAKEGLVYILSSAIAFLFFSVIDADFLAIIAFVLLIASIYSFRNPERALVHFDEKSLLCVCDGVVRSIEELTEDKYAYKIIIESSLEDVAVLRVPFAGKMLQAKHTKGTKISKQSSVFDDLSESIAIDFEDDFGNKIHILHQAKQGVFPLFSEISSQERLAQTTRYGFAQNIRTSLYLPKNFRVSTSVGKRVKASESLIGYFS